MRRVDLKIIRQMDFHIRHQNSGTPVEFANKIGISRSTLFEYLAYMRYDLELEIIYNKYSMTYYYGDNENLNDVLGFKI